MGAPTITTVVHRRVASFLQEAKLVNAARPVIVGVSGGPDSVCLLHAVASLRDQFDLDLHAAHVNHLLRGEESEADAAYVARLCDNLSVPLTVHAADVAARSHATRRSLEEAGRDARLDLFHSLSKKLGAQAVLLGHTADDQAETILMHVIRGSGLRGFRGMERMTHWTSGPHLGLRIARPLLALWRQDTERYCVENDLQPRADSSNQSPEFMRNRVRREVLPLLEELNPRVKESILRLGASAGEADAFLESTLDALWPALARKSGDTLALDRDGMRSLEHPIQAVALRRALRELRGDLREVREVHVTEMLDLMASNEGGVVSLPGGLAFIAEQGRLTLGPPGADHRSAKTVRGPTPILVPGETIIPNWRITAMVADLAPATTLPTGMTACLDAASAGTGLTVRGRRKGDRFQPLGMRQSKRLQDFLVNEKVPRTQRDLLPLVCNGEEILWVVGHRIAETAKVGPRTTRVLRLEFTPEQTD